jgi:hypothetical protein
VKTRIFFSFLLATLLVLAVCEAQAKGFVKKVDCAGGQTITRALELFDGNPITIQVQGTCDENVSIVRDDVTLIADPSGGTVNGSDPNKDTITIAGARTVIDGLTVTGGQNGIGLVGGFSAIRNCTVQNVGQNGITFLHGGGGSVDNCTVQNNGRSGIRVESASATVTNSTISSNTGIGILVHTGGSARIGITDRNEYAGNTISNNQSNGIHITTGGSALIAGNTINGNGTNLSSSFGQFGVAIFHATATLVGNNKITGNNGSGIWARQSTVVIGDISYGLPITGAFANVISGNGATAPNNGGIYGFLGTSLHIQSATINGNTGNGVSLSTRSTAYMSDDTVNNNTGNGIWLVLGGALFLQNPAVTVTGNTQFGLQCTDTESSVYGPASISGNIGGNVSPSCTGF